MSYDFKSELTVTVGNHVVSNTWKIDPTKLRRTVMTYGDKYYYLSEGNVYSTELLEEGDYIHLYDGMALSSDGEIRVLDASLGEKAVVDDLTAIQFVETTPLYEFDYDGTKITTYEHFSVLDGEADGIPNAEPEETADDSENDLAVSMDGMEARPVVVGDAGQEDAGVVRELKIVVKDGDLYALDTKESVSGSFVTDTYQDQTWIMLTGEDGKANNLADTMKWPSGTAKTGIAHTTNNLDCSEPWILIRYKSGYVKGFNYVTGEELTLTNPKSDLSLIDYIGNFFNDKFSGLLKDDNQEYLDLISLKKQLTVNPIDDSMLIDGDKVHGAGQATDETEFAKDGADGALIGAGAENGTGADDGTAGGKTEAADGNSVSGSADVAGSADLVGDKADAAGEGSKNAADAEKSADEAADSAEADGSASDKADGSQSETDGTTSDKVSGSQSEADGSTSDKTSQSEADGGASDKASGSQSGADGTTSDKASGSQSEADGTTSDKTSGSQSEVDGTTSDKASGSQSEADGTTSDKADGSQSGADGSTSDKTSGSQSGADGTTSDKTNGSQSEAAGTASDKTAAAETKSAAGTDESGKTSGTDSKSDTAADASQSAEESAASGESAAASNADRTEAQPAKRTKYTYVYNTEKKEYELYKTSELLDPGKELILSEQEKIRTLAARGVMVGTDDAGTQTVSANKQQKTGLTFLLIAGLSAIGLAGLIIYRKKRYE